MNHVAYPLLLVVALVHVSGLLAEGDALHDAAKVQWNDGDAAPDFDKRRGWGKRSGDALGGDEVDKRRGWGKRADEMDKRRGWGKRSASLATQGVGVDVGDAGAFYPSQMKRRGWGKRASQVASEEVAWAKAEAKRRGWGKRADICDEINDQIYTHVAKAVEVGQS